jgi:hypothetical protein
MKYIKTNELFKEFFKFLKENNAYVQYRANICHDGLGNHLRKNNINFFYGMQKKIIPFETRKNIITEAVARNLINYAFTWSETKERYKYWCELHKKWQNYMDNIYGK